MDLDSPLLRAMSGIARALAQATPELRGMRLQDAVAEADAIRLDVSPTGTLANLVGTLPVRLRVVETSKTHTLLNLELPGALGKLFGASGKSPLAAALAGKESQLPPGCTLQEGMLRIEHRLLAEHLLSQKQLS